MNNNYYHLAQLGRILMGGVPWLIGVSWLGTFLGISRRAGCSVHHEPSTSDTRAAAFAHEPAHHRDADTSMEHRYISCCPEWHLSETSERLTSVVWLVLTGRSDHEFIQSVGSSIPGGLVIQEPETRCRELTAHVQCNQQTWACRRWNLDAPGNYKLPCLEDAHGHGDRLIDRLIGGREGWLASSCFRTTFIILLVVLSALMLISTWLVISIIIISISIIIIIIVVIIIIIILVLLSLLSWLCVLLIIIIIITINYHYYCQ